MKVTINLINTLIIKIVKKKYKIKKEDFYMKQETLKKIRTINKLKKLNQKTRMNTPKIKLTYAVDYIKLMSASIVLHVYLTISRDIKRLF